MNTTSVRIKFRESTVAGKEGTESTQRAKATFRFTSSANAGVMIPSILRKSTSPA